MTVSSTTRIVAYSGDGSTVAFAIPFAFQANGDIKVTLTDANGADTDWTEGTQYDLTGSPNPDTVTVKTSPTDFTPASGETLTIRRVVALTQETDYPQGGVFPAAAHEGALDKLTHADQQQQDVLDRAWRLPETVAGVDTELPKPEALKAIRWNAAGDALETFDPATGGGGGVTDHGALTGLGDDDHAQYHTDARADTWLAGKDSDDLAEGAANLYFSAAEASKLAGVEAGATADQTAADIRALGFFDTSNDGAGSGLDADLLDGNHASAFEPADADILKADTADVLTAGFAVTTFNAGTKSTGTYTPDEADGNFQRAVNGGAHTLAPPTNDCNIVIQYTNNASAGAITTSGFTQVTGDAFTTTDGDDFLAYITKINGFSHLNVVALQ